MLLKSSSRSGFSVIALLALSLLTMAGCGKPANTGTPSRASSPTLAFVGVTVIGMARDAAPAQPDQTVVVEGERIQAIGESGAITVPAGAMEIDGTGKYLMPGLADMHVHLEYFEEPSVLQLFLANGVTTVRNMDGRPYIIEWRSQVEAGRLTGPSIYTAGPLLDGDPPLRPDNTVVRNGAEGKAIVHVQKAAAYDFIKVYTNLSAETYRAILAAAREANMPVAGHVPRTVMIEEALTHGQTAIEHLGDYDDAIEADDSPSRNRFQWFKRFLGMPIDTAKARRIGEEQARRDVWTVPTLVQAEKELAPADVMQGWLAGPEVAHIRPDGRSLWEEQLRRTAARMDDEDWRRVALGKSNRLSLVRVLHDSGVGLLAGSDTPNPFVVPGFSLHEELKLFVDAGLRPHDALAAATREAARFLGDLEEWGTVEVGKRADLLLLDGNPLDDIGNTRRLAGVVTRGRWHARDELAHMLDSVRRAANR